MIVISEITKAELVEKMISFLKGHPNFVMSKKFSDTKYSLLKNESFVGESYRVGGLTGGDCWGGEANQSVEKDEKPMFEKLDSFLECYFSDLTFIEYRKIIPLIMHDYYTEYEYYGNYTNYEFEYVTFNELADKIIDIYEKRESNKD